MLIRFTDDYINEIFEANKLIAGISCTLARLEPYKGNSPELDKLYLHSVILSGIVDVLSNDDNADPASNEALLLCLRKIIQDSTCMNGCVPARDMKNYHNVGIPQDHAFQIK